MKRIEQLNNSYIFFNKLVQTQKVNSYFFWGI